MLRQHQSEVVIIIKFVFMTDPHVTDKWPASRQDNFLGAILEKIRWVVDFANNEGAYLLVGGDWVDTYYSSPDVINLLLIELRKAKLQVFGIIGNHDIYGQNYHVIHKVIAGTLFNSGVVTLLTARPLVVVNNGVSVQLTGANYVPDIDRHKSLYQTTKLEGVDRAIHLAHGFVVNKNWPTFDHSQYTVMHEIVTEADVTCTGHEHHGYGVEVIGDQYFTNPGALARINASEGELKRIPRVTLIKCTKKSVECLLFNVPCQKGSIVLDRSKIIEMKEHNEILNVFKDSLQNEILIRDDNAIFEAQARQSGVDNTIKNIALRAFEEYDRRQT